MFRYTPPWRVLCHSLEDTKRLSAGDCQDCETPPPSRRPPPACATAPPVAMDTPRKWALRPLSPLLQPSDLHTVAGPPLTDPVLAAHGHFSVVVSSQQGGGAGAGAQQDGETCPSSPSSPSSSSGSHCGFYSFVEDPTSPEAELNRAWMVSPQRTAYLATLKEDNGFKLQTYASNRKPQSLFPENNEDSQYEAGLDKDIKVVRVEEDRQVRQDIIRSQAPKKKPPLTGSPNHFKEGFGLSSSPGRSTPEPPWPPWPPEPGAGPVDQGQVNFNAAREQFLQVEQDQLKTLSRSCSYLNGAGRRGAPPQPPDGPDKKPVACRRSVLDDLDDLDSGSVKRSVDVGEVVVSGRHGSRSATAARDHETPIEREIRLIQEREEKLRLSRGLKHSGAEMVQITTKRLQAPPTPVEAGDESRLSVQREVHKDNRRQGEPQQQGGAPWGHGLQQGEPQQHGLQQDEDQRRGDTPLRESGGDDVFLPPCCPHRHSAETELDIVRLHSAPWSCSVSVSQVQDQKTSSSPHLSSPVGTPLGDMPSTTPRTWRDNLLSSGLRSRGRGPPDFIQKEIKEDQRREQELRDLKESSVETFCPAPLVEQAEQMSIRQFYPPGSKGTSSRSSPCPHLFGRPPSSSSSSPPAGVQPWTSSAPPAEVQPPPPPVRGLTETLLQDFEDRRAQLKLEESSYAGILPVDDVNNEVVESTRVICHKNQRALRWEAGVFANRGDR
ncbi:mitotic interactor and substrate of PLK1 [Brachionichthys hirsutus]|uniref:mitotic interactor and substrate of PLK1 n=1 Tax=Brachionichthys hirsutus TaxID=412623 RepID=UPI0036046D43